MGLQNKNISVVKNTENIEMWSQCQYLFAQNIANACRGKPIKKIIMGNIRNGFMKNTVY